jgi:hypothetical protein
MFRNALQKAVSAERPHSPKRHNIIEGPAPRHRVGVPHQRLQVPRPADFLMLKQRPDSRAVAAVW